MADNINREEAVRKLAALIKDVKVAMLTTTDPRGWLHSRPMVTQEAEFDGDLWFLSSKNAAKAADIRDRRQVNVSFSCPGQSVFVSISGVATLVDDRGRITALWNRSYEPWFPSGPGDPDLVLIKVEAEEADCWQQNQPTRFPALRRPTPGFRDIEPDAGV